MKPIHAVTAFVLLVTGLAGGAPAVAGPGRIHGTVITDDGDRYTGVIRWDKNENFWDDAIDANKTERVWTRDQGEGVDIRIFGLHIVRSGNARSLRRHARFSIPFGHLAALEPGGNDHVRLELKTGETLTVVQGADLGPRVRSIVVETPEGTVDLDWGDLGRVEFGAGSGDADTDRLYGTVETSVGSFSGFIVWDKDEALAQDVLDGEDDGRDREIPFGRIRSIESLGHRGSRVTLQSGDVMTLRGTNDVDDDNRGIGITVEKLGTVLVDWSDFRSVTFADAPPSPAYGDFDGGHPLRGTVTTESGETLSGAVEWDKDESRSWESLGGSIQDVDLEIQFANIARIERVSRYAAKVVLRDGLEFTLKDSNDVNHLNQGIVVTPDTGEARTVGWDDLVRVEFATP